MLPVGGLKEKLVAALRCQVRKVLVPKENQKELSEVPEKVAKGLELVLVETMDEVLRHALAVDNPDELFVESSADATKPCAEPPVEHHDLQ